MQQIGTLINNRYKVNGVIGRGGMSQVYSATDNVSGAMVAIKEAMKNGVQGQQIMQLSLAAEGMMLKSLNNPHLPRIYDVIETPESIMIVMDFVQGQSLDKVIENNGKVDATMVIEWSIQICEVLSYLHSQIPPIIYRDMKPANVILRPDGFVMMIDFGTARKWTTAARTSDTVLIGTEGFAAPEQYGGMGQSDARTDIFCLGATMFNLVTGHNPYDKPYGVTPLKVWNPALDGTPIDRIIQKCVARDPRERFQTALELREALMVARGNKGSTRLLSRFNLGTKKPKGWQAPVMQGQNQQPQQRAYTGQQSQPARPVQQPAQQYRQPTQQPAQQSQQRAYTGQQSQPTQQPVQQPAQQYGQPTQQPVQQPQQRAYTGQQSQPARSVQQPAQQYRQPQQPAQQPQQRAYTGQQNQPARPAQQPAQQYRQPTQQPVQQPQQRAYTGQQNQPAQQPVQQPQQRAYTGQQNQPVQQRPYIQQPQQQGGTAKSTWKMVMLISLIGAGVLFILGISVLIVSNGAGMVPGVIVLLLAAILVGIGIVSMVKYIK